MFRFLRFGFALILLILPASFVYAADDVAPAGVSPDALRDILDQGTFSLDTRYRFENVDQNGFAHDAYANTLRTRFGYETGVFSHFQGMLQVENLLPIGSELYNNGVNGMTGLPTVADPRTSIELYQAYAKWSGLPQSNLTFGRQAIALDNERFIGISDWRQLGQTMDALTVENKSVPDLNASYSYVFHVNRSPGPNASNGSYDAFAHLLHAAYTGIPDIKWVGYSYLLDLRNAPNFSSATLGSRAEINHALTNDTHLLLNAEYARQSDYANNPASFAFNYYLIEPGLKYDHFTGKIAYEAMEGNGTQAFQTPLDTAHAFNGWASKFTTTPADGLDNIHITADYTSDDHSDWLNTTIAKFICYDFRSDTGSIHYGNEYDFWLGQTFYKHYTLGVEYADFRADQLASVTNTHKITVQLQVKY